MNHDERQMIDGLFGRLKDVERTAPPRDGDAERFISDRVAGQPGAPYYMAQTIIVQEQALEAAQARIQELEAQGQQRSSGGGGLLGGLFGGGSREERPQPQGRAMGVPSGYGRQAGAQEAGGSPWGGRGGAQQPSRGGGFLVGAAQTAVGVAGGMMLGSMLGGMFAGGDEAQAADLQSVDETGGEDMAAADDMGGMDDGGFGDFEF